MLKATDERNDFAANMPGGFTAFINGAGLADVTISGPGTIDGSGGKWWVPAEEARQKKSGYTLPRPNLIVLTGCKNVRLENLTLQNSPKFHFVPTECEGVVVSNVTILAPPRSPNTDAIDPSSCKNVLITRCRIDVGDDNVAIKSSHKVAGREFASEDITVTDCTFLHGHGLSIGSETGGGVKNLLVKNCTFNGTTSGIRIKSARDRGGRVENLVYRDLVMTNVEIPINITCYYPKVPPTDSAQPVTANTPVFRDIQISNLVSVSQRSAGLIVGLPESCVSNVVLENVTLALGNRLVNSQRQSHSTQKCESNSARRRAVHTGERSSRRLGELKVSGRKLDSNRPNRQELFPGVMAAASAFVNCLAQSTRCFGTAAGAAAVKFGITRGRVRLGFFPIVPAFRADHVGHFGVQKNRAGINPPGPSQTGSRFRFVAGDFAV